MLYHWRSRTPVLHAVCTVSYTVQRASTHRSCFFTRSLFFQSLSHDKHNAIIDKHGAMSSPTNIPPYYKCNSCGHHFVNDRSFRNHFTYSKTCIQVKPQQSLVHLDASSVLPGNEFLIERGPLSFLNDPSFLHASSRAHATSQENECDSSILPTEDYCTTADDNTFELHSRRAAYSTTESSSGDNYFDASYFEDVRDNTLPIEEDPDFVNVGCRLELAKNPILSSPPMRKTMMMICMVQRLIVMVIDWVQFSFRPSCQQFFQMTPARSIYPHSNPPTKHYWLLLLRIIFHRTCTTRYWIGHTLLSFLTTRFQPLLFIAQLSTACMPSTPMFVVVLRKVR